MAGLKLNSSGGGSATLDPGSTASNLTFTFPAASGALLSTASTTGINGSAISSGTVAEAYGGTGTNYGWNGFKNRIINGSCVIAQRGSVTTSTNTTAYGGCDRWLLDLSGFSTVSVVASQAGSVGSTASNSGFVQQYLVTTTGSGSLGIKQRIESYNTADLNGKSITVSLSLYQDTGSTLSPTINIYKPTAQDNYTSATFINGTAVSLPSGVRTSFTYTLTLGSTDASNGLMLAVNFPLGAVTGRYIQIADVQLEKGSTATSFDYRPYGTELALCQRYLPCFNIPAGNNGSFVGQAYNSSSAMFSVPFPVQARVPPSGVVATGTFNASNSAYGNAGNFTTTAFFTSSVNSASVNFTGSSGLVAGNATLLIGGTQLQFTGCEL